MNEQNDNELPGFIPVESDSNKYDLPEKLPDVDLEKITSPEISINNSVKKTTALQDLEKIQDSQKSKITKTNYLDEMLRKDKEYKEQSKPQKSEEQINFEKEYKELGYKYMYKSVSDGLIHMIYKNPAFKLEVDVVVGVPDYMRDSKTRNLIDLTTKFIDQYKKIKGEK